MTVADLKDIIADLPDDMEVVCPLNAAEGFDGMFYTPCLIESGPETMGIEDLTEEEVRERLLLNQTAIEVESFVLVPCGFFREHEEGEDEDPNLN